MYYPSVLKFLKNTVLFSIPLSFLILSTSCGDSNDGSTGVALDENLTAVETKQYVEGEVLVKYRLSAFTSDKSGYLSAEASSQVLSDRLTAMGVVTVEAILPLSVQKASVYSTNATTATVIDDLHRLRKLTLADGISVESIIQTLSADPDIEYAQPNYEYFTGAAPNDPLYSQLWGLKNIGQIITRTSGPALTVGAGCAGSSTCNALPDSSALSGADSNAELAWDITTGNTGQVIAVIDTGVDYNHPDLAANMWTNPGETAGDGIDNDGNGYIDDYYGYDFVNNDGDPMDDNGHGTHIAGTIAGVANNGIGVTGINWNAKIMAIKFIRSDNRGTTEDAIKAVQYAESFGVKITNNSWGGAYYDQALYDAIALTNSLFVASAGNSNWDNDRGNVYNGSTSYPAAFDLENIIAVSATDNEDKMAFFSSYGLATSDVGAPGVNILSTVPTGTCVICNAGVPAYGFVSGTSMAAPHVAGAVSLIMSKWPGLSLATHKTILKQSADAIPALSDKVSSGRINIYNALRSTYLIESLTEKQNVLAGASVSYSIQLSSLAGASTSLSLSLDTGNAQIIGTLSQSAVTVSANNNVTVTANISLNAGISQGKYKIKVNASDTNGIQASAFLLLEVLPDIDLIVSTVSTTATKLDAGDKFIVSASVKNNGSLDVTSSFAVLFYLSADKNFNAGTVYRVGGTRIIRLAAGATSNASVRATIPVASTAVAGVPVGTYYIRAVVDSFSDVVELNEGNNVTFSNNKVTITHEADLVITNVSSASSSFYPGEVSTVSVTIKNQGVTGSDGPCVMIYLSRDSSITTSDTSINRVSKFCFWNLAPGLSSTRGISVRIPTNSSGSYYLGAYADPFNEVIETNEFNNGKAGAIVQVQ